MSCIVIHFEPAYKNVIKEKGVFIDGKVHGYSFRPPKKYKPTKQAFWCRRSLHGIVWNSALLDYKELSNNLNRALKGEYFAKETEKAIFLPTFWIKRWKIWKITAVPKFKISLMKKSGLAGITHSDTRPHFTVQSVTQVCLVFGYCGI